VDFPKFVRDMGVSNLLLKMDIEGEEKNLVPELLSFLPRTCALFIETHHGFEGWQTMSMLLKGVGFTTGITRDRSPYVDGWAIRA
jgi:hypothetical protein